MHIGVLPVVIYMQAESHKINIPTQSQGQNSENMTVPVFSMEL